MNKYSQIVTEKHSDSLLRAEISAQMPAVYAIVECIELDELTVNIYTSSPISEAQQASLVAIVSSHDPEPLDVLKGRLMANVNEEYKARRDAGVAYNGKQIIGNVNAIASASTGKHKVADLGYPFPIPTLDGTKYIITNQADYNALFDALESGQRAKLEALADALDAIAAAPDKTTAQSAHDSYMGV